MTLDESNARAAMDAAAADAARVELHGDVPERGGRGVVIPGGGAKYFPCAWVCVHMLRDLGCTLPVELWHLGPQEMTDEMRRLIEPLGVTCVDALAPAADRLRMRRVGGYQLKAYALAHASFREVLLLDADNVPIVDPTFLFETPQYRDTGALFWPDYGRLGPERAVWRLTGVPYRDEPEFESGQMVVDTARCRAAVDLALWMNQHSEFWYRHVHGDKDTFHLAWRRLGLRYAMPDEPCFSLFGTMCQHDFAGRRIFQHRNFDKWTLDDENPRFAGFAHHDRCVAHLERLKGLWPGRPRRYFDPAHADDHARAVARELTSGAWVYRRVGHDARRIAFRPDGRVGAGAAAEERGWNLERRHYGPVLALYGRSGLTCLLSADGSGPAIRRWRGTWNIGEGMPVELTRRRGANGSASGHGHADVAGARAVQLPANT